MSVKLLWTGLTLVVALTAALEVFGIHPQKGVVELVGGVLMLIGLFVLWTEKQ